MNIVNNDADKFLAALKEEKAVNLTSDGKWYVEGRFMRFIRWIFRLNDARLRNVCSVMANLLDGMEKQAVLLQGTPAALASQKVTYSNTLKVAKAASSALKKYSSNKAKDAQNLLKRRIIAFTYRIESSNGGKAPTTFGDVSTIVKVMGIAEKWKKKQEIFKIDPSLHELDKQKIRELCRYRSFAKLLLIDKKLQNDVFGWTIRTCNPVAPLVQYPERCARIHKCLLNGRIGRFAYANVLSIEKGVEKTLTLPFEGKKVSILDETQQVTFATGSHTVSIKGIFEDMKRKNDKQGDFEFIGADGFHNWRCDDWSYYDAKTKKWVQIDLKQKEWWNDPHLPVFETLTADDVMDQYGVKPKDDEWVIMAMATRQSHGLYIDDCHGYEQVLVPDGKGNFRIHIFGKYAEVWPKGFLGKLGFLANTNKAKFFYSDPSPSYSGFRQQAAAPFVVTREQGLQEMERIRGYAQRSRSGNLVFMFPWENCAYFPQTGLETLLGKESEGGSVPNLFRMHLLDASAAKPLNHCFNFTNSFPDVLKAGVVRSFEVVLGAHRGVDIVENGKKVRKSASTCPFRHGYEVKSACGKVEKVKHHIFLPSFLHQQIIDKKIGMGVVWAGHQHVQRNSNARRGAPSGER